MRHASMILAAGMLAVAATEAGAETLTSRILEWNAIDRTVTFENLRQMQLEPSLQVENLQPGDEVTVMFDTGEDGVETIYDFAIEAPAPDLDEEPADEAVEN